MGEEDQKMEDILYRAARWKGSPIPVGVNFHSRTASDNNNAFHVAAQYDNHEFIRGALAELGEFGFELLCQKNSKGNSTPLHLAAQSGHLETVKALVEAHNCLKGNVCWREGDSNGDTPLHKALVHGYSEIAEILLHVERALCNTRVGGLTSIVNNHGESLAYLAAENLSIGFLYHLLEDYDPDAVIVTGYRGQTVLHSARRFTNDHMRWLIETVGCSMLKKQDELGKTVVHYAVEENRVTMVDELLKVDTLLACVRDKSGLTPLDVAFRNGMFPMVEIILKRAPQSVEIRDDHGRSPLHHTKMDPAFLRKCRVHIDDSILKLLISGVDEDGNTPFHVSLINSEQGAAEELRKFKGCLWSLRNKDGCSLVLAKLNLNLCPVYRKLSTLNYGIERPGRRWYHLKPSKKYLKGMICTVNLEGMEEKDCETLLNKIGIAAALLLPLNFAAAFSVPGGYDSTSGMPVLRDDPAFHRYVMSNLIAFLTTVLILIMSTFGVRSGAKKKSFVRFNIAILQVALFATIFAFTSGLNAIGVIDPSHAAKQQTIILCYGTALVTSFLLYNYFS